SNLALHHQRGVLVDSESHQRREFRDRHEQSIESPPLSEVRVDEGVVAKQSKPGTDVLLDEFSFLIDLVSGERRLRKRRRASAGAADDRTVQIRIPDRCLEWGSAQRRDELDLISAAEENSASVAQPLCELQVGRMIARFD